MNLDKVVKDITLEVAGQLDLSDALASMQTSLARVMPIDELVLIQLGKEDVAVHLIGRVSESEVDIHDPQLLFTLSDFGKDDAEERLGESGSRSLVLLGEDISSDKLGVDFVNAGEKLGLPLAGDIVVSYNHELSAALLAVSGESNVYNQEHVALFEALDEFFASVLKNAIRYAAVQSHRDALASDNQLFRDVTVRLTGESDIARAFQNIIVYLQPTLPVAQMMLVTAEPEEAYQRILLRVMADGSVAEQGELVFLEGGAEMEAHRQHLMEQMPETFVNVMDEVPFLNNIEREERIKRMAELGLPEDTSVIVLGVKAVQAVIAFAFSEKLEELARYKATIELLKEPFVIAIHNAVRHFEMERDKERLQEENRALLDDMQRDVGGRVIGMNGGLKHVMSLAGQVAKTNSPVLLLGETGSGKEVVATSVHRISERSDGPFVSLNCGAIPETLIDSELFGHEKGSFTGANQRKMGRFERANGGTLFLDEVGELPPSAQVKLLRVLQEKEFERIGGAHPIRADVRLIAATNRDLPAMVRGGQFREDLWFRLNVFPIQIPPLRERKEDIPSLAYFFVETKSREMNLPFRPSLSAGELEKLTAYDWPGNVRELQNAIERALILSRDGVLQFPQLTQISGLVTGQRDPVSPGPRTHVSFDEMSIAYFRSLLETTGGRISGPNGAAKIAGINPSTLRSRLKKLGID